MDRSAERTSRSTQRTGCVVLDQPQRASIFLRISFVLRAAADLRYSRAPFLKQALRGALIEFARNGIYLAEARVIRWGPFFDGAEPELAYHLYGALDASALLKGVVSFDGRSINISGSEFATPSSFQSSVQMESIQADDGGFTFKVQGVANGRFSIERAISIGPDAEWFQVAGGKLDGAGFGRLQVSLGSEQQAFFRVVQE